MNILLANRWYPSFSGYGGIAAYQRDLGRALVNRGNQVHVFAARYSSKDPEKQNDHSVSVYRQLVKSNPLPWKLPFVRKFARSLREYEYSWFLSQRLLAFPGPSWDTIVEFADVNAEGYVYLQNEKRMPSIVRCHTPSFVLQRYYSEKEFAKDWRITARREKFCIENADAVTAPSIDMARTIEDVVNLPQDSVKVIPNAVDSGYYAQARRRLPKNDDSIRVLHVGRLDRTKGIEVLMRAIPATISSNRNIHFVFVGPDLPDFEGSSWMKKMTAYFRNQGVSDHVTFLGEIKQNELLEEYRLADIVVVPSILYESFSYTCAQAISAGLPVVASTIGGIPETVGNAGLLVNPGDSDALGDAIIRLANDGLLRTNLADRAIQNCKNFDAMKVAELMETFYREVVAAR